MIKLDPKEVYEMAIAIRKAKIFKEMVDATPFCEECGPNVKHINFEISEDHDASITNDD